MNNKQKSELNAQSYIFERMAKGDSMSKALVSVKTVLPVKLTPESDIYAYKGLIIIGAHYPITPVSEKDQFVYIEKKPLCEGPLNLELVPKHDTVFISMKCSKCGLNLGPAKTSFPMKHDWFQAADRWLINGVEAPHNTRVYGPRVNLSINQIIYPVCSLLVQEPISLVLVHSIDLFREATVAYSRMMKDLLLITKITSDKVKKVLGFN